jgi:predicted dinucleotide-binding enzyme
MKIAVFGSDTRALAIGQLLLDAGYDVCDGAADAVCEVLIFAGPREQRDDLLAQVGWVSARTVVVDAMEGVHSGSASGPVRLARKLGSRRVVRVAIALPRVGANVPYCGDDYEAKSIVGELFRNAGCTTTDRGPLANAAQIESLVGLSTMTRTTTPMYDFIE